MANFTNPILFSKNFNIDSALLSTAGLIDPFLNVDMQLFIDPVLLEHSSNQIIKDIAYPALKKHFQDVIRLLSLSQMEGDVPWRAAQRQLSLREAPSNGLGYGTSDRSGASRPNALRDIILQTAKEIIVFGSRDPEMISLMGFFEENVGPDTISDLTSRIIQPHLATITHNFCKSAGIPVKKSELSPDIELPHFRNSEGREKILVLIPIDIVRELPVANDFSDVQAAIDENDLIRNRVNEFLAGIVTPTIAERKKAIRDAIFYSTEMFEVFIATMKENTSFYDPNRDTLGYYKLKDILLSNLNDFKTANSYNIDSGADELKRVAFDTIEMFKHHVENGNLWEELWINDKPKKERAAQLIYFAIADCFCKANNIDISPEANMGGGPIDFKYSKGYNARVLIEMKKSTGSVEHGFTKQLEIYKKASRTTHGIFVVLDYGKMGNKLINIEHLRQSKLELGEQVSDIIVIDATQKDSASKRN